MRTNACSWTDRISAFFDGEGSAWERWLCRRHARHCSACREWLRQVEAGYRLLRAEFLAPADPAAEGRFADAVMSAISVLPHPTPALATAVPRDPRARTPLPMQLLAAGSVAALTAGLFFPLYSRARENAFTQSCQSNLHQLAKAINVYAEDNDDRYPPANAWPLVATGYTGSSRFPHCPRDPAPASQLSYEFVPSLATLPRSQLPAASATPIAYEGSFGQFQPRHLQHGNVLFGNGRVVPVSRFTPVSDWPGGGQ